MKRKNILTFTLLAIAISLLAGALVAVLYDEYQKLGVILGGK